MAEVLTAKKITQKIEPSDTAVRRMSYGDLAEIGEWLLWRLKPHYPQLTEKNLVGWISGQMNDNSTLCVRCNRAVGLFQIDHKPLSPIPDVREIFLFIKGRDSDGVIEKLALPEAVSIYRHALQWGKGLGSQELEVDRNSDLPREVIKETLGKLFVRESVFVKVET